MRAYEAWQAPADKTEQAIYNALRTYPNQIAGRPNAGNLALQFIHQNRVLPRSVMEGYCRRALRAFMPDANFRVEALEEIGQDGFQRVTVFYEVP